MGASFPPTLDEEDMRILRMEWELSGEDIVTRGEQPMKVTFLGRGPNGGIEAFYIWSHPDLKYVRQKGVVAGDRFYWEDAR